MTSKVRYLHHISGGSLWLSPSSPAPGPPGGDEKHLTCQGDMASDRIPTRREMRRNTNWMRPGISKPAIKMALFFSGIALAASCDDRSAIGSRAGSTSHHVVDRRWKTRSANPAHINESERN